MDRELLDALEGCAAGVNALLDLLERDQEDMPECVGGALLAECQRGTRAAQRAARALREELLTLLRSME